jgi:hypothetical protein
VWAVGRDELRFDPAAGPRQQLLDQFCAKVSGIVQKDVDQSHAWIHRLDRHRQHGRTQCVHHQHILHDGLAGLQIDRAVDVQLILSAALFHRDQHLFRCPAPDRLNCAGGMRGINKNHRFIGG